MKKPAEMMGVATPAGSASAPWSAMRASNAMSPTAHRIVMERPADSMVVATSVEAVHKVRIVLILRVLLANAYPLAA
jgi:hypothetical protein